MKSLLLGCGNNRDRLVKPNGFPEKWDELVTLDADPSCNPDVVHDLNEPLPFPDDEFDEVHAYEILEHYGKQGDWKSFFDSFAEIHRVLKDGGHLIATVPMWDSPWAWGDPGHVRVITKNTLIFLNQSEYQQVGKTRMSDYRHYWKRDFETVGVQELEHIMAFILKAVKNGEKQ